MQDGRDDNRGRLCDSRLDREQGNRPYRGGRKKAKDPLEARKARKEVLARREEPLARLPRRPPSYMKGKRNEDRNHSLHGLVHRLDRDIQDEPPQEERREIAMATEAQRRALNNYRKKTKSIVIRFYPNEADEEMHAWLKSQENTTEYLKALVRSDMEKSEPQKNG